MFKMGPQSGITSGSVRGESVFLPFPDSRGHRMSWLMSHPIFKASGGGSGLVLVYIPLALTLLPPSFF